MAPDAAIRARRLQSSRRQASFRYPTRSWRGVRDGFNVAPVVIQSHQEKVGEGIGGRFAVGVMELKGRAPDDICLRAPPGCARLHAGIFSAATMRAAAWRTASVSNSGRPLGV